MKIKKLLAASVTAGIRFRDTNRAIMTMGSNTQAICIPAIEKAIMVASKKNFGGLNLLFIVSRKTLFSFLSAPNISMVVPKGHTQPQKNLPAMNVKAMARREKAVPARIFRSLNEVASMMRGSILKNTSEGNMDLRGYVVDHKI